LRFFLKYLGDLGSGFRMENMIPLCAYSHVSFSPAETRIMGGLVRTPLDQFHVLTVLMPSAKPLMFRLSTIVAHRNSHQHLPTDDVEFLKQSIPKELQNIKTYILEPTVVVMVDNTIQR
jgi:hypothetical protein